MTLSGDPDLILIEKWLENIGFDPSLAQKFKLFGIWCWNGLVIRPPTMMERMVYSIGMQAELIPIFMDEFKKIYVDFQAMLDDMELIWKVPENSIKQPLRHRRVPLQKTANVLVNE
eukprot:TRINITY_DN9302_c0_g1::TRINITY_DN9302_c0_g1_i1::g.13253::m.13253 TRINITY_DN9302_c0_g1::TRINITY_DN9302_c0_g1_i1::g.13253  ORF type:complete len:127 (-),score=2.50 TRINITY_DN9302_c0_g1_i1:107-454(-)